MARFTSFAAGRETIDALASRWRDECLVKDGSLLFDERSLWTADGLAEFERRFTKLGVGAGGGFAGRLQEQLATAPEDLKWLAAELLAVYALPVTNLLGPVAKRQLVERAAPTPLGEAPHWNELARAFDEGIGHPGARYNVQRDLQVRYLVEFARRIKLLAPEARREVVQDSSRLLAFADEGDPALRVEMRHIVLHLLRPDDFERIFSSGHKRQVADAFSAEVEQAGVELDEDLDRRLLAIRKSLESRPGADGTTVDFYLSPYREQWQPPAPDQGDDADDEVVDGAPRWFWVNQGQTYRAERQEGILWAPLLSKNGLALHHWERLDELRVGDVIIHYSGAIRAVSRVTAAASREPKPESLRSDAWEQDGRLARARYVDLQQAIPLNDIPSAWRTDEEGGPFTRVGSVQQGYLFPLSGSLATRLIERFDELRDAVGDVDVAVPIGPSVSLEETYHAFAAAIAESGLLVPEGRVRAVMAALVTKPFGILSGLSGSGKTQLALRLGEWLSASDKRRSLVVAVRPDWTGPESLFGYEDALRPPSSDGRAAWFVPRSLSFMLEAAIDPEHCYLLVLDEMNLAHVERYFSDFLSGFESGEPVLPNLELGSDGEWRERINERALIELPTNLLVVGTVNVDETTYMFSPKVLDRAFTFEVRTTTSELSESLRKPTPALGAGERVLRAFSQAAQDTSWHLEHPHPDRTTIAAALTNLHEGLSRSSDEFGHRVFYESLRYAAVLAGMGDDDTDVALDSITLLKILPRIHGSRRRVEPVLLRLRRFAITPEGDLENDPPHDGTPRLPQTLDKVERMLGTLHANQFVSFSE